MKTKALATFGVIAVLTLMVVAQQQRSPQTRRSGPGGSDPAIIAKLSEIVAIRERVAKNYEMLLAAGRASADGLTEIELAEARISLAEEQGQPDSLIEQFKGLVAAHERRVKRLTGLLKDRGLPGDVDRARAALLEAEVRLLRAQK